MSVKAEKEPKAVYWIEGVLLFIIIVIAVVISSYIRFTPKALKVDQFIEAESMTLLKKSSTFPTNFQSTDSFTDGTWSKKGHLFIESPKPGDFIEFELQVKEAGMYRLDGYFSKSYDYSKIEVSLDGKVINSEIDLYSSYITNLGPIFLVEQEFTAGAHAIKLRVTGKNSSSDGTNHFFGVDGFVLKKL